MDRCVLFIVINFKFRSSTGVRSNPVGIVFVYVVEIQCYEVFAKFEFVPWTFLLYQIAS